MTTKRNMTLFLVGVSHKSAPVDVREKMGIGQESAERFLKGLATSPDIDECLVLSTCNRVEILGLSPDVSAAVTHAISYLGLFHGRDPSAMKNYFYIKEDRDAVRHVLRVSSSLDSMVVGEPQILGQVKDSYRAATASDTSGPVLNRLLHRAFFTAKRVKNETGIASRPVSISSAALWLCEESLGGPSGKSILMIGAGEMGEETLKQLACAQPGEIRIANRTRETAQRLCERFVGKYVVWEDLAQAIGSADIVISCTGSERPIITSPMIARALNGRNGRPLAIIDIAVPRDVDENVGDIAGVSLYNIDSLNAVVRKNITERESDAVRSERIVEEETAKFMGWLDSLDLVPTIVLLRKKLKLIGDEEVRKTLASWEGLGDDEIRRVRLLVNAIINKVLHDPTVYLKRDVQTTGSSTVELIRGLFGLDGEDADDQDRDKG
ncbi:MAG: glutamyl-tRNA reductase [Deltaproteobacteria bacterium]|nr:glutamyl-tRNA reductase [Candidatus Zymogenaceae bacterium]